MIFDNLTMGSALSSPLECRIGKSLQAVICEPSSERALAATP